VQDKITKHFKPLNQLFASIVLTTNKFSHHVQGRISVSAVPTSSSPNPCFGDLNLVGLGVMANGGW